MYDQVVNRCFFVFNFIPDKYRTQEMCVKVASVLIVYCPDKYKT